MLNGRKRFGVYAFCAGTFLAMCGLMYLAHYLYSMRLPGRYLTGLFVVVSMLLFIFSLWAVYRMHKDGLIGVIISDEGVTDLSTGYYVGTVLWKDIERIKVMDDLENLNYQYVVLVVKNPNQYIVQEKTAIKRRSLILKFHTYGSPICISTRALCCTFNELYSAINDHYRKAIK